MDGGFREMRQMKELLLAHLDLIQRQEELLSEKDKQLLQLKHENDSVGQCLICVSCTNAVCE